MARKAGLIGFLVVQAIAIVVWLMALLPHLGQGDAFFETAQQIWSGGGHSFVETDFRTGQNVLGVERFHPVGDVGKLDPSPLLLGTLLMLLAAGAAGGAIYLFRSKPNAATGASIVALLLGLGGCAFIAMQWLGDTAFPPGFMNTYLLNSLTRAFLVQVGLGFIFMAICSVLVIAGVAKPEKPYGFQLAALNWIIVTAIWVVFYLVCHVAPFPFGDAAWGTV